MIHTGKFTSTSEALEKQVNEELLFGKGSVKLRNILWIRKHSNHAEGTNFYFKVVNSVPAVPFRKL